MEGIVRNLVIILISGSLTPALICQESNWKIDPKVNLFYGYTGNNVTYEVKKFNSVKFTYRANQWRGPGIDSSKFIKREEYNGIVQTRDYFTWEPEISLRRQFWNKRMDVGLKFFYRMKKVDIQYYFQYPFDYKNPDFSTFENSTSANVHYFGFDSSLGIILKGRISGSVPVWNTKPIIIVITQVDTLALCSVQKDLNLKRYWIEAATSLELI